VEPQVVPQGQGSLVPQQPLHRLVAQGLQVQERGQQKQEQGGRPLSHLPQHLQQQGQLGSERLQLVQVGLSVL
jgi:hypothetical protein